MHLNIYTEGSFTTMEKKIRIGICGYGNLGHGVELAVNRAEDMELVGVFSRRDLLLPPRSSRHGQRGSCHQLKACAGI